MPTTTQDLSMGTAGSSAPLLHEILVKVNNAKDKAKKAKHVTALHCICMPLQRPYPELGSRRVHYLFCSREGVWPRVLVVSIRAFGPPPTPLWGDAPTDLLP